MSGVRDQIIGEVARLTGHAFVPTARQEAHLAAPVAAVRDILRGLPRQLDDLRKEVADAIDGLTPQDVEPRDVAGLLVLNRFVPGFSSNAQDFKIRELDHATVYGIGLRKGRAEALQHGPMSHNEIAALYAEILGRTPDEAGFEFWSQALREGMPLPAIRASFLAARAAGAR